MAESSGENAGEINSQQQYEISGEPQEAQAQEVLAERAIEQRQVSEGAPTKQTPKFPTQIQQTAPQAVQPAPISDTATQDNSSSATRMLPAQDADLIEKEWVERAKSVVAQTQDDPYRQKSEMSKIKADYIKKRFDKTLPLDDVAKP